MNNFMRRAITGLLFAAIMISGLVIHEYGFLLLILVIHTGCLWEYYKLVDSLHEYTPKQQKIARFYNLISGTIIFYLLATGFRFLPFVNDYIYFFIAPLLLGYLIVEFFLQSTSPLKNAGLNMAGVLYITFPLAMAVYFPYVKEFDKWFPERSGLLFGILLIVWANDTMAYITGSLIGKHKMLPAVSPKKTWEGFFGGFVFSLVMGWILSRFIYTVSISNWLVIAAIVSIFGTIGDFVESMIKRNVGVKDSGSILPGHGGFLDRFDAFIFCIPFVFVYYMIVLLI